MSNYMSQTAKTLGVELHESFKIFRNSYESYHDFMLSENGLLTLVGDEWQFAEAGILQALLTGKATIVRKPYKPKVNETYWFIDWAKNISDEDWEENVNDLMRYFCGNCFRTADEAKKHRNKILEKLTMYKNKEFVS